jgi:hypothetical protein
MYCFHDKVRIYFISFIVQISPFVHLFTLKIVFRWGVTPPLNPPPRLCPGPAHSVCHFYFPPKKWKIYTSDWNSFGINIGGWAGDYNIQITNFCRITNCIERRINRVHLTFSLYTSCQNTLTLNRCPGASIE